MNERERLVYIINHEGLTSKQFSEMVGIGAGTISNITSGRNNASLDVLQRVRARFPKYNAAWLYEGKGEIMVGDGACGVDGVVDGVSAGGIGLSIVEESDASPELDAVNAGTGKVIPEEGAVVQEKGVVEMGMNRNEQAAQKEELPVAAAPRMETVCVPKTIQKIVIFYSDGTFEER